MGKVWMQSKRKKYMRIKGEINIIQKQFCWTYLKDKDTKNKDAKKMEKNSCKLCFI